MCLVDNNVTFKYWHWSKQMVLGEKESSTFFLYLFTDMGLMSLLTHCIRHIPAGYSWDGEKQSILVKILH